VEEKGTWSQPLSSESWLEITGGRARRRMTISESKTVTDCQDWLKPPLYPEFRKSHAPRPPVALFADRSRARVASSIQSFDNSVVKVNEFGLTQSVDIDLCHVVTANVMEQ
jgi:hypothetical protein